MCNRFSCRMRTRIRQPDETRLESRLTLKDKPADNVPVFNFFERIPMCDRLNSKFFFRLSPFLLVGLTASLLKNLAARRAS
jgi:hypothetical protein